jgi:soluble lytic murein transglycosylase
MPIDGDRVRTWRYNRFVSHPALRSVTSALLAALLVAPAIVFAAASAPSGARSAVALQQQDDDFLAARDAFRVGNAARLDQAAARLRGHPLEAYAQYWQIRLRLETADPGDIQAFLARNANSRVGDLLRADWLKSLGRRGQWEAFAAERVHLINTDPDLDCLTLSQRRAQGDVEALREARALWFTSRDLPESCTPLFQELINTGSLRVDDIWARVRLALEQGQVPTARRIAVFLPAGQEPDPKALDLAASNPQAVLDRKNELRTRAQREVVMFAAHRIARTSAQNAAQAWGRIDQLFSEAERGYVWGAIGWLGARWLDPDALRWFRMSGGVQLNDEMLGWRVRAALRAGAWSEVLTAIDQMSAREQQDSAWRYWRARALRELKRPDEAMPLLAALSREFNFYGQLALDDIGPVLGAPSPPPYKPSREEVDAVGRIPSIQRALVFYRLQMRTEGNREWFWVIRTMKDEQLLATAEFARRNRLWDRAIATADRTREVHDLSLRFVAPFREELQPHVRNQQLDEAWVLGLIRQESRFIVEARSSAGASGLMQLMPATAAWVAKRTGMLDFRQPLVNDVQVNLNLGTAYLRTVLNDLDDHPVLASAAYNAGPGRARAWRTVQPLDAAIYAESIPFGETRDYVKKVMSNATYYAQVFGHQVTSLRTRIGTIPARSNTPPGNIP